MDKLVIKIELIVSVVFGYLLFLIGDINDMIKLLCFFMVIDFITGMIKAIVNKNLNSKAIFKGGYRKALIFLVIMIGNTIDMTFKDMFLRETIIIYYLIQEGVSILENINTYIELPEQLQEFFTQMKGEGIDE